MTEGKVLQFQNSPATEAAGNTPDDGTHELKHAGDTAATLQKTLEFSMPSEFSVGTGEKASIISTFYPLGNGPVLSDSVTRSQMYSEINPHSLADRIAQRA